MSRFIDFQSFRQSALRGQVGTDGIARLGVDLSTNTGDETVSVDLPLAGPAQLVSLRPDALKGRTPAPNAGDFRAGALAFVEFNDPALPWAFSFDGAPTLGLICVPESAIAVFNAAAVPNAVLNLTPAADLPDPTDFGWMSHVQTGQGTAFARCLCPQELTANTRYVAAVVPLTRAGVRAGLGLPPDDNSLGDGGKAWQTGHPDLQLPTLIWWRFGTGSGRGAEDVLRDLRARDIDASPQTLAFTDESADLMGVPRGSTTQKVTLLAEAPSDLAEVPELTNPLTPTTQTGAARLPLPSYARAFAAADDAGQGLRADDPLWFRQLNRTPGYRILAGMGAALVRRHQDDIIGFIRSDAGQIEDANALLSRAHLGMRIGAGLHSDLGRLSDSALVRFAGPAHTRTKINGGSVARGLAGSAHAAASGATLRRRVGRGASPRQAHAEPPGTSLAEDIARVSERIRRADAVAGTGVLGPWEMAPAPARGQYLTPRDRADPANTVNQMRDLDSFARQPDGGRDISLGIIRRTERDLASVPAGPPPLRSSMPSDLGRDLRAALDPFRSVPPRLAVRINGDASVARMPPPRRLVHEPVWPEPILERLFDIDPDTLAPGLSDLPPDTITGLILDGAALESVVAGANHEVLRELAWRGHPVGPQPSPVRRAFPALDGATPTLDLSPVSGWDRTAPLGTGWAGRVGFMAIMRSDFFRMSADVIPYLCPASWFNGRREINPNADLLYPVAMGQIGLDMVYLGFEADVELMRGKPEGDGDAGMFLVFEIPSDGISFGLGGRNGAAPRNGAEIAATGGWQSLDWDDIANARLTPGALAGTRIGDLEWARSSADMAGILMERPLVMAIHATELLGPAP